MPRKHERRIGARTYKDYTEDQVKEAVEEVRTGLSLRKAAEKFGISRCALTAAVKGKRNKVGRPFVLPIEEQKKLAECMILAGDWGFPLTVLDIRLIVKGYLDRSGRTEQRFKENMPGVDFVESFIKRHSGILSNKLCQNVKRSRAAINEETINSYFDELALTVKDVDPSMIVNYDETNITDDPGRKKVVVRRGTRHPERIIDFSKSSTSVMFSGSANGTLLPPYITYKAGNLYDSWTESGPKGAVYNRSKSGWFTLEIFEDWFKKIALPYFNKFDKDANKVLIGDNLSSHISPHIIDECKSNNIKFVLLPPNSTQYTQPLDVAFFRPLKIKWRETLNDWKEKNRGTVPKDRFPRLLKKCIDNLREENITNNLKSGFRAAGIVPLDRQQVLKRIPDDRKNKESEDLDSSNNWVQSFETFLKESRKKETEPIKNRKKRKLNVPAGKGIEGHNVLEAEACNVEHQASTSKGPEHSNLKKPTSKRTRKNDSDSSQDDDGDFSVQDSDSDLILSDSTDVDFEVESITEKTPNKPKKTSVQIEDLQPDRYVIVKLIFNENTKKEVEKQFYAIVLNTEPEKYKVKVKFFRKCSKSQGNNYVFPIVDDEMDVNIADIVTTVQPVTVNRGRHTFPFELN